MWYILLLLAGFLPLIYGASLLVDNASSLARKLNIPSIVIGLTIVGFGTSTPEFVVNVFAAADNNQDIVLGNILGSNILNILGILGISALVFPLAVKSNTTWLEIPLCLLSAIVLMVMANDSLIDNAGISQLSRIDGIIMLLFFTIFLVYNINLAFSENYSGSLDIKERSYFISAILIIAGLLLLVAGGRIIVFSAVKVAGLLGMSERIIALTIISIGTSLPELATSVMAAIRRNSDIAIGNIVGSNIFNVFFILGISTVINPVTVTKVSGQDLIVNIIASILLFIFVFTGKGRKLSRLEGGLFVTIYIAYLLFLLIP
jgi:cation:H+ antiporter